MHRCGLINASVQNNMKKGRIATCHSLWLRTDLSDLCLRLILKPTGVSPSNGISIGSTHRQNGHRQTDGQTHIHTPRYVRHM